MRTVQIKKIHNAAISRLPNHLRQTFQERVSKAQLDSSDRGHKKGQTR